MATAWRGMAWHGKQVDRTFRPEGSERRIATLDVGCSTGVSLFWDGKVPPDGFLAYMAFVGVWCIQSIVHSSIDHRIGQSYVR
jgi:hypothetical protein